MNWQQGRRRSSKGTLEKRPPISTLAMSGGGQQSLSLKSSSVGKDPGAVGLSKSWRVNRRHQGIYSGGKVGGQT